MNLKPGFLGSQRPGEAENFVRYQTRWGNGMSNLKKIGKLRCKVAKKERNPDQGDGEDALHYVQQHKNGIQKKGGK